MHENCSPYSLPTITLHHTAALGAARPLNTSDSACGSLINHCGTPIPLPWRTLSALGSSVSCGAVFSRVDGRLLTLLTAGTRTTFWHSAMTWSDKKSG